MASSTACQKTITILLVEDNLADQEMTRRAFKQFGDRVLLKVVDDGEQALDYLLRRDIYADANDAPPPDLMLLDLNLPKLSGHEILRRVRQVEELRHLPIIVLTTSQAEEDILASYRMGCNAYLTKPARFELYQTTLEQMFRHWFEIVKLPPPQA